MLIEREKTNGTLTDLAGEDVVELLSVTCGYLFKSEPELYKEVHEIMNPTIKLTREIAAEEIKRIQEKAAEETAQAREETAQAKAETAQAKAETTEKIESSIRKYIQIGQQNGEGFKEINDNLREIFTLSETEAEEKMKEYWKNGSTE